MTLRLADTNPQRLPLASTYSVHALHLPCLHKTSLLSKKDSQIYSSKYRWEPRLRSFTTKPRTVQRRMRSKIKASPSISCKKAFTNKNRLKNTRRNLMPRCRNRPLPYFRNQSSSPHCPLPRARLGRSNSKSSWEMSLSFYWAGQRERKANRNRRNQQEPPWTQKQTRVKWKKETLRIK